MQIRMGKGELCRLWDASIANSLYQNFSFISHIADIADHKFYMIGDIMSDPCFLKKRQK